MKYRIVFARHDGPAFYEETSLSDVCSLLMAFFQGGCVDNTASLWKSAGKKWVPVFPYQMGGRE